MFTHFEHFLKSGLYLRGWSPKTASVYKRALQASSRAFKSGLRLRNHNALSCVSLVEQGVLPTPIRLKQIKSHTKPVKVFSEAEIKLFLASKPKRQTYLWT